MAKILIIEDDDILARYYKKILSAEGHSIETASDGGRGFEKAKSFKPELIILDIMMPEVNGMEVLKMLKQHSVLKKVPIIVLTNLAGEVDADFAKERGANEYLVKSKTSSKQVIKAVNRLLPITPST